MKTAEEKEESGTEEGGEVQTLEVKIDQPFERI